MALDPKKLEAIRERHKVGYSQVSYPGDPNDDMTVVLAEVERLQGDNLALRATLLEHLKAAVAVAGVTFEWRDGRLCIPEVERLRADAESMRALLREVEWGRWKGECQFCGEAPEAGHDPNCRLKAFLK
jgi:hypothetical protein